MTPEERYKRAMQHDYPKDFISDSEWDFIEALASAKGDSVKNKSNTACRMPKSGKENNMAKKQNDRYFTAEQKRDYFGRRSNDPNLSDGQRKWARKRLSELNSGGQAQAQTARSSSTPKRTTGLTASQQNAHMAGIGYGAAKEGGRVPVKDENKPNFRDGVKEGKALARRQKQSF